MTVIERYEALKSRVVKRKDEFSTLIDFMEKETDYLTSPASTRFHLCRKQGLLEHSVNVAETMLKFRDAIAPEIDEESCIITALIHDLGKAGMPGRPQYLENEPTPKQKQYGFPATIPYRINENLVYLSVPVRSLYLALPHISLSESEVQAVMYHDGQYVDDNKSVATKETPLLLLLQYADTWSTFVIEKDTKRK
ncbi:MAG: HD domain-containing protein [Ruminococcaceae bacterium]|nr:HD domain-containing protein [Oscillospiraceae bacterium]